ncbi:MAG: cytochrome c3 family protein [Bacillota bacterium]|nr:cytochrome c3 family protein [Bacillota bacterium]
MRTRVCGAVLGLLLFSQGAWAGIQGSPHDFRPPEEGGPNTRYPALARLAQGHPCRACHLSHSAKQSEALFAEDYGQEGIIRVSVPSSSLCLSCHDGQIKTPEGVIGIADPEKVVSRRHKRHRVEKVYPPARPQLPLRLAVSTDEWGRTWAVGEGGLKLPLYRDPATGETKMGCGTCHNPHEPGSTGYFLRGDSLTALCQVCHLKKSEAGS